MRRGNDELLKLEKMPPWEWPDRAGEIFRSFVVDQEAAEADRCLAVRLAGDLMAMNDDLAGCLLTVLQAECEPEALRVQAAISLGPALEDAEINGFDDWTDAAVSARTYDTIRKALRAGFQDARTPDAVRRAILEASVRAPQDWHATAVRTAFESRDPDWNLTAVFCLEYVKGFEDEIMGALESTHPGILYHAVRAAGNWELEDAWPRVSALARSRGTDRHLRLAAIEAIATISPEEAIPLLSAIAGSKNQEMAEAATEALAMAEQVLQDGSGEDDDSEEDDEEDVFDEGEEFEEGDDFDDDFDEEDGDDENGEADDELDDDLDTDLEDDLDDDLDDDVDDDVDDEVDDDDLDEDSSDDLIEDDDAGSDDARR